MFSGMQDDAAPGAQSEARLGRCRTGQYGGAGCFLSASSSFQRSIVRLRALSPGGWLQLRGAGRDRKDGPGRVSVRVVGQPLEPVVRSGQSYDLLPVCVLSVGHQQRQLAVRTRAVRQGQPSRMTRGHRSPRAGGRPRPTPPPEPLAVCGPIAMSQGVELSAHQTDELSGG